MHIGTCLKQGSQERQKEPCDKIKSSSNSNIMQMSETECDRQSLVRFLHLNSDKSVTSMKRVGILAYPTDISLRNISYDAWENKF